jgi:hypothetical protein
LFKYIFLSYPNSKVFLFFKKSYIISKWDSWWLFDFWTLLDFQSIFISKSNIISKWDSWWTFDLFTVQIIRLLFTVQCTFLSYFCSVGNKSGHSSLFICYQLRAALAGNSWLAEGQKDTGALLDERSLSSTICTFQNKNILFQNNYVNY